MEPLEAHMQKGGIAKRTISYKEFVYRQVEVMGPGSFNHVHQIIPVEFKIP